MSQARGRLRPPRPGPEGARLQAQHRGSGPAKGGGQRGQACPPPPSRRYGGEPDRAPSAPLPAAPGPDPPPPPPGRPDGCSPLKTMAAEAPITAKKEAYSGLALEDMAARAGPGRGEAPLGPGEREGGGGGGGGRLRRGAGPPQAALGHKMAETGREGGGEDGAEAGCGQRKGGGRPREGGKGRGG